MPGDDCPLMQSCLSYAPSTQMVRNAHVKTAMSMDRRPWVTAERKVNKNNNHTGNEAP
ncbi:hypothetical protein PISMIDRAFT_687582 [Pisolithus microcarpus 441]|uniref:Uncharacterized protein n=1 Tax=Pisolithus microcarpus 441 TaxID=765257 RepID=A0A0C9YXR9_9AGAM|nr:hypothetical protein PISMIDRAFT_687582 [Pisolithus microcarpus 441]